MPTDIFETRESQVRSYCMNWPATFEKASGSYQYTEDGSKYLDFFSGAGALNYGHNHPELRDWWSTTSPTTASPTPWT